MDFCQSLDPRKGTLGEELEIVDESGGLMNCMSGVRGTELNESDTVYQDGCILRVNVNNFA